jgi:threonine dehydrogenase-like Zn-dependent dehydrogenase
MEIPGQISAEIDTVSTNAANKELYSDRFESTDVRRLTSHGAGTHMSAAAKLAALAEAGKRVRVGVIGAGKFGSMFLAQAPRTPGFQVIGIADRDLDRARRAVERVGWPNERAAMTSFDKARRSGGAVLTEDAEALIAADGVDAVVEATGDPAAGVRHALACCRHKRHVVMAMLRPTRSPDRFLLTEPPRRASSTRSPTATSRR